MKIELNCNVISVVKNVSKKGNDYYKCCLNNKEIGLIKCFAPINCIPYLKVNETQKIGFEIKPDFNDELRVSMCSVNGEPNAK